jgi:molecular chaperone HtpG
LHAVEAEELDCFSGLKLKNVKSAVAEALSLIGRNGLFDQYTRHDISHIDQMLRMMEWLIPEDTRELLTPTDSLLQVLSIYLHDLGMLITTREYESRESTDWREYVAELFGGERGADYRAKVEALPTEAAERFLYQEFVRAHHGERVRAWISGSRSNRLGEAEEAAELIAELLRPLPTLFREDLGLVCESHHKTNLSDVSIYPISRPYGPSEEAAANVQYAAFILRTADLLHITSDRTPSVLFRLIAPEDPLSQEEWAKQAAVTAVRSKPALDSEGNVDIDAPRDTIEVVAQFTDEEGFFGLSAYLTYVADQLQQTHEWSQEAQRRHGSVFTFPWRHVDESQILTKDFLPDNFEFSLDTKRVLDLLTGHTLYNNTSVVLRELVQNSIDAIRAQRLEEPDLTGLVRVEWNSADQLLRISDNGTGMSQTVIERHLLKVGSSRYQDPEFQREHPEFSPISRFGIGVLSTFMVSDAVSIETVHPEDETGRQLNLRSVHGRYLVRLFEKGDSSHADLGDHGTRVTLRLRPSADIGDIAEVLREWILVPGCAVQLQVDEEEPLAIGFPFVSEALTARVEADGIAVSKKTAEPEDREVRVIEVHESGLALAFAAQWSTHFQEWSLLSPEKRDEGLSEPLGIAVEGIRVEQSTPGFRDQPFLAMANATGLKAPRTDVSRSGLEQTPERLELLKVIYMQYAKFIAEEVENLKGRGFSLNWRAQEASYLSLPLTKSPPLDQRRLNEAIATIPSVVVDDGKERKLLTTNAVEAMPVFWTVESNFFRSAESLLREMPSTVSVRALIDSLGTGGFRLPEWPLVSIASVIRSPEGMLAPREVAQIAVDHRQRRVDLAWEAVAGSPRWTRLVDARIRARASHRGQLYLPDRVSGTIEIGHPERIKIICSEPFTGVKARNILFLLPGTPIAEQLLRVVDRCTGIEATLGAEARIVLSTVVQGMVDARSPLERNAVINYTKRVATQSTNQPDDVLNVINVQEFADAASASDLRVFDPWSWNRKKADGEA